MKKDFNRKPGSDKFRKDSGGFKKDNGAHSGRDGDKKPFKKDSSDRPKRRDDDRPKRSFNDDKPKRSFDNDRPSRSFGDNKPKRSFGKSDDNNDRPKRSFDNDRPGKSYGDDKPKRSFNKREDGGDRPKRSFDNDRPRKSYGDDKPKRSFNKREDGEDRPKRSFDNDRPGKSYGDDKPKRSFNKREDGEDRPKRSFDNDRPGKSYGDDKPKRSFDKKGGDKEDRPRKKKTFGDIMNGAFEGTPIGKELKKAKEPIVHEEKPVEEKPKKKEKKAPQNSFERSVGKIRTNRGTDMDAYIEKKVGKASDEEKPKKRKRIEEEEEEFDIDGGEATELMPLNKYIAHSGECSRREAAELVKQGKVKVNGELVTDPGHKVTQEDQVTVAGKKMVLQKNHIYILLNKPKGFITTTEDPEGRRTVMDLVEDAETDRIFPVGRLDRNTTGLLLMTNDGALAQKLSHPSHSVKKVYQVTLDKNLTKADFDKIAAGFDLDDGPVTVDEIAILESKNEIGIEIHSGRNRIVRRIFESLGYQVEKLDRVMYAGLTKKNLPRSNWRYLTEKEVILLKHFKN